MECSPSMTISTTLLHKTFHQGLIKLGAQYLIFLPDSSIFQENYLLKYSFKERFWFYLEFQIFLWLKNMFKSSLSLPIFLVISFNTWNICMNILQVDYGFFSVFPYVFKSYIVFILYQFQNFLQNSEGLPSLSASIQSHSR